MLDELIPIVAIFCAIGLPMIAGIVSLLLKHQRQMAELIQQGSREETGLHGELEAIRRELSDLKNVVLDHSMSLDNAVERISRRLDEVVSLQNSSPRG